MDRAVRHSKILVRAPWIFITEVDRAEILGLIYSVKVMMRRPCNRIIGQSGLRSSRCRLIVIERTGCMSAT